MSDAFKFDPVDAEIIARMYKQRMPARAIARIVGKPPLDVSNYIRDVLMKRPKPPVVIGKNKPELIESVKLNRVTGGLRHYNDPLAAKEGSRKLLEAIHKYFEKRERAAL